MFGAMSFSAHLLVSYFGQFEEITRPSLFESFLIVKHRRLDDLVKTQSNTKIIQIISSFSAVALSFF